ncbi:DUF4158 domain-containing protein [Saccharopolyspora sp. NPDC050389]|uniref:DUF4158 domain-containing protein n=1 Tax=Saccharopolyspora sp. NPDC050389 TaxID=3155516 RepID=UPI0033DE5DF4
MASIDHTAYPRFKGAVAVQELAEALTPTADGITWARGKPQHGQHLLALLVQLQCYQRLSYFAKHANVSAAVVDHVRGVLVELPETVVAETDADRTAKRTGSSCASGWA